MFIRFEANDRAEVDARQLSKSVVKLMKAIYFFQYKGGVLADLAWDFILKKPIHVGCKKINPFFLKKVKGLFLITLTG